MYKGDFNERVYIMSAQIMDGVCYLLPWQQLLNYCVTICVNQYKTFFKEHNSSLTTLAFTGLVI